MTINRRNKSVTSPVSIAPTSTETTPSDTLSMVEALRQVREHKASTAGSPASELPETDKTPRTFRMPFIKPKG